MMRDLVKSITEIPAQKFAEYEVAFTREAIDEVLFKLLLRGDSMITFMCDGAVGANPNDTEYYMWNGHDINITSCYIQGDDFDVRHHDNTRKGAVYVIEQFLEEPKTIRFVHWFVDTSL
jgi:hypothetical protein